MAERAPHAGGESHRRDQFAVTTGPLDLLWAGSINGMEQALVERADIRFHGIDTGKLRGMDVATMLRSMGKIVSGVRQSLALLNKFRPHVCFVTGGYVCAPVVLACWIRHIPVLIYLPDIVPGLAIRGLSKLAARVAISFAQTAAYFGGEAPHGKAVVTGYPVRPALIEATGGGQLDAAAHAQNRAAVRRQLAGRLQRPLADVERDGTMRPLILVWGGSQGSRTINQATWGALSHLLPEAHILHVVGQRDWPLLTEQQQTQPVALEWLHRYHPVAYLHEEMIPALVAADLTVARAGASSLGEFPIARLPAVLAPLAGVNQWQNAELLANQGGAVIVQDAELSEQLAPTLLALLHDPAKRLAMETSLADLARPEAALNIARELYKLAVDRMTR